MKLEDSVKSAILFSDELTHKQAESIIGLLEDDMSDVESYDDLTEEEQNIISEETFNSIFRK